MKRERNYDGLTKKQLQIITWLADGLPLKAISAKLGISMKGLEHHTERIYRMLKIQSRAQLIKMAVAFGLTSLCLLLTCPAAPLNVGQNTNVLLAWDYPSNYYNFVYTQIQTTVTNPVAFAALTNVTWSIYAATNIAGTNTQWYLVAQFTNPPTVTNAGWVGYNLVVPTIPGAWQTFYAATLANSGGSFFFQSLAATAPPLTNQLNLQIGR